MKKKILIVVACILAVISCLCMIFFDNKELNDSISTIQNVVQEEIENIENIDTYEMTTEEIDNLATTEIIEQTEEEENAQEQEVEDESFELQGEIAYEGDRATTWDVELGDYAGLTYYSQIDSRWRYHQYSSIGDSSQTIGTSGCRTNFGEHDSNSNKGNNNTRYNAEIYS